MTLRQKRLLHFWACVPGALLFALWIVSGAAMVYDSIRGGLHALPKPHTGGDLRSVMLAPSALARNVRGPVSRIVLTSLGAQRYARVTTADGTVLVDAATGRVLSPLDAGTARSLLTAYEGQPPLRVEMITTRGYEYKYGELPAWRGTFANGRIVHITASSGELQSWTDREGMIIRAMYYWFHAFQFTDSNAVNAAMGFAAISWAVLSLVSGLLLYRRGSGAVAAVLLTMAVCVPSDAEPLVPKRIVALAPSCAEIVAGLGLGDVLVGVTDHTDWPLRAKALPSVGSYADVNVEAVLALRPDLVVATDDGNPPASLRRLERAGLRVVVLCLHDFTRIQHAILTLGRIVDRDAKARQIVAEMRRVAACVAGRTHLSARPRVLFAFQMSPLVSAGKGTFTDQLLQMSGAQSITAGVEQAYPRMTMESVLARAPEVVIVSTMDPEADRKRWRNWLKRWPAIPATRTGRVHVIDSTNLDRPSQRVVLGLVLLAKTIHPSLFARGECAPDLD